MYNNGERTDTFWDNIENKIVELDSGTIMSVNIYNGLETDNRWQTFLGCITSNIKSVNYNGKECYSIRGFISSTSLNSEDTETYIEKDTGLLVKSTDRQTLTEKEYKFEM